MAQDDRRDRDNTQLNWIGFPGGELEGRPPKALCPACREALRRAAAAEPPAVSGSSGSRHAAVAGAPPTDRDKRHTARTLCFQCYRADLERNRSLRAAGQLNTASPERFQGQLPFQPVDAPRLQMLKAERLQARVLAGSGPSGIGGFADRRRRAQISARHALQSATAPCGDLRTRLELPDRARAVAAAIHAAELQLPESWLPFVVSR